MVYDYSEILSMTQNHMSRNSSFNLDNFSDDDIYIYKQNIKSYIEEAGISCNEEQTTSKLVDRLFNSMVYYDCLTEYLTDEKINELGIEEIYGQWDCIFMVTKDKTEKLPCKFPSPSYAKEILARMSRKSNNSTELCEGTPISLGEFRMSVRYGAVTEPICPKSAAVNFSIRIVKASDLTKKFLIEKETATEDMADFAVMCAKYGINVLTCGKVHSGKSGTLSFIINEIKKDHSFRIGTIEHESRELNPFVYDENGNTVNNAFSWVTRPSLDDKNNITAEQLVATNNRFSADLVAFGEIRGNEALAILRAGNTGQSIIATTHANSAASAYSSLVILCKMSCDSSFDDATLYNMAIEAFPIVMFQHESRKDDGTKVRRIVEIAEGIEFKNGKVIMNPIYKYEKNINSLRNGKLVSDGEFKKVGKLSDNLRQRLLLNNCPSDLVDKLA